MPTLLLALFLHAPAARAAVTAEQLLDAGRADEALRLLEPQATGNHAAAYNLTCRVYYELAQWDDAVKNCEQAVQLDHGNAMFQLWLGRAYGEKADVAPPLTAYSLARKTLAAFTSAHELDSDNVLISRDLGEYYASAPAIVGGGSAKALALAAEMQPRHPVDAAWLRALVASNQGDGEQAEHAYSEYIRLANNSATSVLDYARFLRTHKHWEQFQQTVERAVKSVHITPTDRYDAAELLEVAKRNLPLAAEQMRSYIQSGHPEEGAPLFRAHFLLGEIFRKSGDTANAAAEYRASLALASNYRPAIEALNHLRVR